MLALPPLSLYIHIPWCVKKCPYCDFNSHESRGDIPEQEYINALIRDFDQDYGFAKDREITSIFIGGGTPSLFSSESFTTLLKHIESQAPFAKDIEITLEANPGTAEAKKFEGFREAGINRLSMGIQSFSDIHLTTLGRIHDSAQAEKAINLARQAGFDNFNLDIMHGLPNQSEEEALSDLSKALEFKPPHLSWYQLTIEPNTAFYSKPPTLPMDDVLNQIQMSGERLLFDNGLSNYEVSAFSEKGRESLHNKNYWSFGDYLGIGAGAHGKLSLLENDEIIRLRKHRQPNHYLGHEESFTAERSPISLSDRPLEYLMNSLRLKQGFKKSDFEQFTAVSFNSISKRVQSLVDKGLLETSEEKVIPTKKGYRFLNNVLEEFL